MKLRLVLVEGHHEDRHERDVVVSAEPEATIGEVAAALAGDDDAALTLVVESGNEEIALPLAQRLGDDLLAQGSRVRVASASVGSDSRRRVGTLVLVQGAWASTQREIPLYEGATTIGTDPQNDVVLEDPTAAAWHARVFAGTPIEVLDLDSGVPVELDGDPIVARARVHDRATIRLGRTEIAVIDRRAAGAHSTGPRETWRPPRVVPRFEAREIPAPNDTATLAPTHAVTLEVATETVTQRIAQQRDAALRQWPGPAELAEGVIAGTDVLWTRRPDHDEYGSVRIGVADAPRQDMLLHGSAEASVASAWRAFDERTAVVSGMPVSVSLPAHGSIGVVGDHADTVAVAGALMLQFAGLHTPDQVALAAIVRPSLAADLDWLKWLPHTWPEKGWLGDVTRLVSNRAGADALLTALESAPAAEDRFTVLIVSSDAPVDRARVLRLAERGPREGVHVVWVSDSLQTTPGSCRAVADLRAGTLLLTAEGHAHPVTFDRADAAIARDAALALAATRDVASVHGTVAPPDRIDLVDLLGHEFAESPQYIAGRWEQAETDARRRRRSRIRAVVGSTGARGLQLTTDGSVTVVGGATGAGKSALLRTWLTSLALSYGPQQLNFLIIDVLGGGFVGADLPHTAATITELSAAGEHRLDLLLRAQAPRRTARSRDYPGVEARLVVVVEEADALQTERPGMLERLVELASSGGPHVVVATARPRSLPEAVLRAAHQRVALRMSAEDSLALVGSERAAAIDVTRPGRAIASIAGGIEEFQVGYLGAHALSDGTIVKAAVARFGFGDEPPLHAAPDTDPSRENRHDGATIIAHRPDEAIIARSILDAAGPEVTRAYRLPPALADEYDLLRLTSGDGQRLTFGVLDDLDRAVHRPAVFTPDADRHLVVSGPAGSGRTTVLRTLAVSAALTSPSHPVEVYALGDELAHLAQLANVGGVVRDDDPYGRLRMLRMLRARIAERETERETGPEVVQRAARNAGRLLAPEEFRPRTLVLYDGDLPLGTERQEEELWRTILAAGPAVGVHVVVVHNGPHGVPSLLARHDPAVLRLGADAVTEHTHELGGPLPGAPHSGGVARLPAGRGVWDGQEVQVATAGAAASINDSLDRLADAQIRADRERAERLPVLPDPLTAGDLPPTAAGRPVLGVRLDDLEPVAFDPVGALPVLGETAGQRTGGMLAVTSALRRAGDTRRRVLVTTPASPLLQDGMLWDEVVTDSPSPETVLEPLARGEAVFLDWTSLKTATQTALEKALETALEDAPWADEALLVVGLNRLPGWGWTRRLRERRRGLVVQTDRTAVDVNFGTPDTPRMLAEASHRGYWVEADAASVIQLPISGFADAGPRARDAVGGGLARVALDEAPTPRQAPASANADARATRNGASGPVPAFDVSRGSRLDGRPAADTDTEA